MILQKEKPSTRSSFPLLQVITTSSLGGKDWNVVEYVSTFSPDSVLCSYMLLYVLVYSCHNYLDGGFE